MEQRPRRRARGGVRPVPGPDPASRAAAPRRSAEPPGTQLWLFPSAAGLRRALPQRTEATRQMCCTQGRLVVLERGGAGVEVHQLPAGSDGAKKPSEWAGRCPLGPSALGWGCESGRPGAPSAAPAELPESGCGGPSLNAKGSPEGKPPRGLDAAAVTGGRRNASGRVAFEFRACECRALPYPRSRLARSLQDGGESWVAHSASRPRGRRARAGCIIGTNPPLGSVSVEVYFSLTPLENTAAPIL